MRQVFKMASSGNIPLCELTGEHNCLLEETGKCPIEEAANLIGKKWTILILRELLKDKKRFNEIQKSLGRIGPRVLSSRLDELEENGIVKRVAYAEVPVRVEYSLTERGGDLRDVVVGMSEWWRKWNGNGDKNSKNKFQQI